MDNGVFIAVPCNDRSRYSAFWHNLLQLKLPPGSMIGMQIGPFIVNNQNKLAQQFLDSTCGWFLLTNDDNIYPLDIFERLTAHGKNAVVGLSVNRKPPHTPLIYDLKPEGMMAKTLTPADSGLIRVDGSGGGGLLLSRRIFETIPFPWWEVAVQADGHHGGEDLQFCRKLIKYGIPLWCDLDCRIGHITEFALTPNQNEAGEWIIDFKRH